MTLNAKQQARHEFRVRLFTRRGWPAPKAEHWADRLVQRDADLDERRLCIECEHLMRSRGCKQAQRGALYLISSASTGRYVFEPLQDVLQRCERFTWMTK